jgi:hypothetical protein
MHTVTRKFVGVFVRFRAPASMVCSNFFYYYWSTNYLPRNGHYYEFVAQLGIPWNDAKSAAETNNYYGLQVT